MSVVVETTVGDRMRSWRPTRGGIAIAVLLVVAVAVLVSQVPRRTGYLDPTAVDPQGSRAVASILADLGVDVREVQLLDDALAGAPTATVLVTVPGLVSRSMVERLLATGPAAVVLVAPVSGDPAMERLAAGVEMSRGSDDAPVGPGCTLRTATRAGSAELPGLRYDARAWSGAAQACYDRAGAAGLVALPARGGAPATFLLGSAHPLTNGGLDQEGNAALALGLLGSTQRLVWWRPSPADPALAQDGGRPLSELVPAWVVPVLAQLLVASLLVAWWRGRRLGPLAVEHLPVVVRAGEATAGRARLLRANGARGEAAAHLRARAREHVRTRLGLPLGCPPERLVLAAAVRTGRSPEDVGALLYGQDPTGDDQLVRLSGQLESLVREVGGA